MRQVVHKLFFIWDYEKEETWLNEMAAKGFALAAVKFLGYEFEDALPGEYHVCVQIAEHSARHPETERYIRFLEDTGIQHVGTCVRNIYFRKKTAEGHLTLFSDRASRIKQINGIITLLSALICANLFNACVNMNNYVLYRHPVSLFGAAICLLLIGLLTVGIVKLFLARKKLKSEQQIFE